MRLDFLSFSVSVVQLVFAAYLRSRAEIRKFVRKSCGMVCMGFSRGPAVGKVGDMKRNLMKVRFSTPQATGGLIKEMGVCIRYRLTGLYCKTRLKMLIYLGRASLAAGFW